MSKALRKNEFYCYRTLYVSTLLSPIVGRGLVSSKQFLHSLFKGPATPKTLVHSKCAYGSRNGPKDNIQSPSPEPSTGKHPLRFRIHDSLGRFTDELASASLCETAFMKMHITCTFILMKITSFSRELFHKSTCSHGKSEVEVKSVHTNDTSAAGFCSMKLLSISTPPHVFSLKRSSCILLRKFHQCLACWIVARRRNGA